MEKRSNTGFLTRNLRFSGERQDEPIQIVAEYGKSVHSRVTSCKYEG